jgi:response regulator of citrate/malate metabolism
MKKEKNSLSTRLRSKEEELEQQLEKNTQLRQQLRNSEKVKRQQLDDVVLLQTELEKERQLKKEGITLLQSNLFIVNECAQPKVFTVNGLGCIFFIFY